MTCHTKLTAAFSADCTVVEEPSLTPLEWKVVSLALREVDGRPCDAPAPTSRVGRALARWWQALTGAPAARPLADPRLEALRRFVCAVRANGRGSETLAQALEALGFTRPQLCAVALLSRR